MLLARAVVLWSGLVVVVFFDFFAAEGAELVFDGLDAEACAEVHVDGFHLGGVELEEAELGADAVVGGELGHVEFEVGHEDALVSFGLLLLGLEVVEGVGADVALEWVFFVGCAFLAASCFLSFHVAIVTSRVLR